MKGIWIAWENHRRNKGISNALGWKLYELVYSDKFKIYRYLVSSFKTISVILKENPRIVAAQNPSKFLAFVVILFRNIFSYKVVIDAHNRGIFPLEGKSKTLMLLAKYFQKHADLTIVTNDALRSVVEFHGGKAFVLPDRIPMIPEVNHKKLDGNVNVAFICTFDDDEPYLEVIDAARSIPEYIVIYFTGKHEGKVDIDLFPRNIRLLGFIPDDEYWSTLSSADIIVDLTLREDCLVCGAYEGVALGKPLVLSDTKALKSYFNKGCIYVSPTASSIAAGILSAVRQQDALSSEILRLRSMLEKDWEDRLSKLKSVINSL